MSLQVKPCHFPCLVGKSTTTTAAAAAAATTATISSTSTTPPGTGPDELTAAFALLLRAYTGSDNVSFGVVDGRPTQLLTAELDPTATLSDSIACLRQQRRRQRCLASSILVETAGAGADAAAGAGAADEFNTTLVLQQSSFENVWDSHLILCAEMEQDAKLNVSLRFSHRLLDDWAARNVLATFEHILCNVVTNPTNSTALLKDINLVSARDQHFIGTRNAVLPPAAPGETLNQRLQVVFHDHHHREAVYSTAGTFTYRQLDDLSALLAGQLVRLGVQRNMIVPICMDKSRWATCAMVAVWKAGAAVTTMDPSYPTERLLAMIGDVDARILISDRTHASKFPTHDSAMLRHVLADLDQLPDLLSRQDPRTTRPVSESWRMAEVKPDDLAQVAWTSGSSGKPKAVLHTHRRLTSEHRSYVWNREYNGGQRVLQFGSYAFVAGVNDAFHTMLHAATLCVPSESERTSGLPDFMSRARVSRAYLTPSVLRTLTPSQLPHLKHLCVGGESIDEALEQQWSSHHVHFISLYGATEGGFMIKQTANPHYLSSGLLPVGGVAWLVDPGNVDQLVPVGAVGEIVFESHELAMGYLNDPDKTASTFIAPPIWARGRRGRYLRMGDLARQQPDGSFVILGRADTQVKIRGQRVDLQDVEHSLRTILPANSQVVVELVLPCDAPEVQMLTAFCVLAAQDAIIIIDVDDRRAFAQQVQNQLERVLPTHMIPRAFLFPDHLPGGYKTDRKKLRTDASKLGLEALLRTIQDRRPRRAHQNHHVATESKMERENERALARLWAKVLPHLSEVQISRRDSFIALGGDSIAAIRLVVAAREEGMIGLTTQTVLQQPILEDMALAATTTTTDTTDTTAFSSGSEQPSDHKNNWTVNGTRPDRTTITTRATDFQAWAARVGASNGGWIDHFGYDFDGILNLPKLQTSCQQLVIANDVLGAVFFEDVDGEMYMRTRTVAANQEGEKEEEAVVFHIHPTTIDGLEDATKRIYARDRTIPLGHPIVRFDLLRAAANRHRLIMRISHAQYDGFCAPLIDEHLRLLYLSAEPPRRTLPFHHYSRHIHNPNFIRDAELYWTCYLKDSRIPRLVEQHRPPSSSSSSSSSSTTRPRLSNILDGELTTHLAAASLQHEGINLAAVVKSAWALILGALSQSRDVVFGDFISGRQMDLVGIETVVGPCVNFTPVRVRLHSDDTNRSLLQRVQADLVSGIPYEALGFRHIIDHCAPSWGPAARYSSIINFLTVEAEATDQPALWSSAGDGREDNHHHLQVTSLYEERQHDKTDLWLLCRQSRNRHNDTSLELELSFRYSTSVYSDGAVARIASLFGETLETLTQLTGLEDCVQLPGLSDEERQLLIPNVAG